MLLEDTMKSIIAEAGFHLTMTDVLCDPEKTVRSVEFKSVCTETFFGLAAITLAEVGK